jgi:hypothetical protein
MHQDRNDCNCMWCSLGRMFKQLAEAGIHNQKDLDERLQAIEAGRDDKRGSGR